MPPLDLGRYAPDPIGSFMRGFQGMSGIAAARRQAEMDERRFKLQEAAESRRQQLFDMQMEKHQRERDMPEARARLGRAAAPRTPADLPLEQFWPGAEEGSGILGIGDLQSKLRRVRTYQELAERGGEGGWNDIGLVREHDPAFLGLLNLTTPDVVENEERSSQAVQAMLGLLKGPRPKTRDEALDLTRQFLTTAIEGRLPFASSLFGTLVDAYTKAPDASVKLWGDMKEAYQTKTRAGAPPQDALRDATVEAFGSNADLFEGSKAAAEFFEKTGLKDLLKNKPSEPKTVGRRLVDPKSGRVIYEAPEDPSRHVVPGVGLVERRPGGATRTLVPAKRTPTVSQRLAEIAETLHPDDPAAQAEFLRQGKDLDETALAARLAGSGDAFFLLPEDVRGRVSEILSGALGSSGGAREGAAPGLGRPLRGRPGASGAVPSPAPSPPGLAPAPSGSRVRVPLMRQPRTAEGTIERAREYKRLNPAFTTAQIAQLLAKEGFPVETERAGREGR